MHRRPRDHWRRLQFVVDEARRFAAAARSAGDPGGARLLRPFLGWAEQQRDERVRVPDSGLADPDDDAVRILTIHAAKGLEFPVVVLAGLNTDLGRRAPGPQIIWDEDDRAQVRISKVVGGTSGYDRSVEHERAMDEHEQLRLLYVGATRACERLLVSTHRLSRDRWSHAARLAELVATLDGPALVTEAWPPPGATTAPAPASARPDDSPTADPGGRARTRRSRRARTRRDEWRARRDAVLATAEAPVRSATAIAALVGPAAAPPAPAVEAPPDLDAGSEIEGGSRSRWLRPAGEAATAFGRAVHAALQDVDLPAATDLGAVAERHARAEGAPERAADVAGCVTAALASPTVHELVAGGRVWREVYVGAPLGGVLVEGFVDLLGEAADGLVVVDYKTDAADPDVLLARYAGQLAAYAVAVEQAVGRPVARALLVCCGRPGEAVERELPDLAAAMAAVHSAVS